MKFGQNETTSLLGSAKSPSPLSQSPSQAPLFCVAVVCLMLCQPAAADRTKIEDSELAWRYHCTTCHGQKGVANSDRYPNLAGQNALYLEARLKSFRAKEEPRNQMNAQAAGLTDEEITRLADYFSKGGAS
ncbi:MAG: c-type cytochrome [Pseudomonadota bacterium]